MLTMGNFPAFLFIWANTLILYPMTHVIMSLTLAEYLIELVVRGDCGDREVIKRLIAAAYIGKFDKIQN